MTETKRPSSAPADWAAFKEQVKNYAFSIGIDKIGFTDAKPLTGHLPRLLRRKEAGFRHAINEGDPYKRVNPELHMPEAKSIISMAIVYPSRDPALPGADSCIGSRGRFSCISRGQDYHGVMGQKLEQLKDFILSSQPWSQIITAVDKEELLEKAIAVKAGLGWFGKNTLLVTPEYGSWVYLGELITDLPFPPDRPLEDGCAACRRCIESCPTGALDEDKNLNPDRCLAGITQSKHLPAREIRAAMGVTLYGCDLCQQVCPQNTAAKPVDREEFRSGYDEAFPLINDILGLTGGEFKTRFGHTSGAWRGRTPVQRNAVIAAGNLRDETVVPILIQILLYDTRAVLRGAAAWALGEIGTAGAAEALRRAVETEKDPVVKNEITNSLNK